MQPYSVQKRLSIFASLEEKKNCRAIRDRDNIAERNTQERNRGHYNTSRDKRPREGKKSVEQLIWK